MGNNKNLNIAKKRKNDEFYTLYEDIEKELSYYKEYFKDKIVYSNCDTSNSNFVKYFQNNFKELGLKDFFYSSNNFSSPQSIELLKKADIVVTNPPFSIARQYISLLFQYNKKFLIIGDLNWITYLNVFSLFKENKMWLGYNSVREFTTPCKTTISIGNKLWFTNLSLKIEREFLTLSKSYSQEKYPKYDNYNAININKIKDIPKDYTGVMGVPITIMVKYNPKQFEILGMLNYKNETGLRTKIYTKEDSPKPSELNRGATLKINDEYKVLYHRILIKNKLAGDN